MCFEVFLRVAQVCDMFAYRTKHTPCVLSGFFGWLGYVTSLLIDQGTRHVKRVLFSGRSVMSDIRLQNEARAVCSALFLKSLGYV